MINESHLDPDIHLWPEDLPEDLETDPYGHLTFAIGTDDDFWCFDYAISDDRTMVRLHAVINSETGSFIQDAESPATVPVAEALSYAQYLVDQACDWCGENELDHDSEGWNQNTDHFVDALRKDIQA